MKTQPEREDPQHCSCIVMFESICRPATDFLILKFGKIQVPPPPPPLKLHKIQIFTGMSKVFSDTVLIHTDFFHKILILLVIYTDFVLDHSGRSAFDQFQPRLIHKKWIALCKNRISPPSQRRFVCLFGFLTSSSTTRLYRGRVPRQSVWQFYVLPHMRQSWEIMTSVSAGHIILTPTQPVGSGQPHRESNPNILSRSRALYRLSYRAPLHLLSSGHIEILSISKPAEGLFYNSIWYRGILVITAMLGIPNVYFHPLAIMMLFIYNNILTNSSKNLSPWVPM